VDLTKATMYHYFSSKAEILDAICDLAMSAGEQAIYSGVEGSGDAAERLRSALLEYVMALTQQRALSVLISSFDELTPKSRPQFDKRRRAMTQAVVKTIEEGIRTGTLAAADPHLASLAVFGALNWIYSWYMPDGKLEPEQVADLLVTHVMNGLLPREPAP
jgi:AcrR family transcriptional regulator